MANSFLKKDQELKNRHKTQSVNSKFEEMAKRTNLIVEKDIVEQEQKVEELQVELTDKKQGEERKESSKKRKCDNSGKKFILKENNSISSKQKNNKKSINEPGISTEEFLDLNIQLDRFEGNNTSVTISIDIYEKIKGYSDIKNLTMNFFVNKLIRVGLEKIDDLTIEEIQKNMCYNAKTKTLPFCIDEKIEAQFNLYMEKVKIKGYKFSRNTIICALISSTLERFHN